MISTSRVETLLNKENVTLKELMDEDDILQECKAQMKNLIEFLTQPESLEELVTLITQEPSEEIEEKNRYKYPNIACELLTADVAQINDALASNEALLNKLYSYIDTDKPLNPLLASFFSKTFSLLITKKTEPVFEFLKSKDDFLSLILNHIETSAIMDLLLRMATCAENNDSHVTVVKWLHEQKLVKRLVGLIDPAFSEECNTNASQTICDIVKASREFMSLMQEKAEPNPLLDAIESTEIIAELLDHMLNNEKRECVLVSGILAILSLLEFKKQGPAGQYQNNQLGQLQQPVQAENAPQCFASLFFGNNGPEQMTPLDAERLNRGVDQVLAAVTPRLGDFTKLLLEPPAKPSFSTSMGVLETPLGWTRLEVAHLLSALLNTNNHGVNTQLSNLGTLNILLDLFFKYSWNNFLHTQVEQLISTILHNTPTSDQEENKVHPLLDQLFTQGKIIQRILDAWEENEGEQSKPGCHRRGYMGHLIKISNHIVQNAENGPNSELIKSYIKDIPEEYSKRSTVFLNETLAEVNKKQNTPLVGVPLPTSSLDDDCADFREIQFSQESALQQAFSDYQMQQMTSNFVDQFGFNDEEFLETEESITGQLDRLARVNFQFVGEDNMQRTSELFEQTCRERSYNLGDADSDEDVWEDKEKEITFSSEVGHERSRLSTQNSGDSSDSDEEVSKPSGMATSAPIPTPHSGDEVKMEVDQSDHCSGSTISLRPAWATAFPQPVEVVPIAMDTTNPWDTANAAGNSTGDQSWADFSSFSPFSSSNDFSVPSPVAMETAVAKDESSLAPAGHLSGDSAKVDSPPVTANPVSINAIPVDEKITNNKDAKELIVESAKSAPVPVMNANQSPPIKEATSNALPKVEKQQPASVVNSVASPERVKEVESWNPTQVANQSPPNALAAPSPPVSTPPVVTPPPACVQNGPV